MTKALITQPTIARNLRSTYALVKVASELIEKDLGTSFDDLLLFVKAEIYRLNSGDAKDVVLSATLNFIKKQAKLQMTSARAAYYELTGYPLSKPASGVSFNLFFSSALLRPSKNERSQVVDLGKKITSAVAIKELLTTDFLEEALIQAWDSRVVSNVLGDLELAIEELSTSVIDAATIAEVLIRLEATKHIALVMMCANRLSGVGSFRDLDTSDLIGYGYCGLLRGLEKYDPATGFKFSTYGVTRINGFIRDGLRAESPLPKRLITFANKVKSSETELVNQLQRFPTLRELAEFMGEDFDTLNQLQPRLLPTASLDAIQTDNEGSINTWLASSDPDAYEVALDNHIIHAVGIAMGNLSELERQCIQSILIDGCAATETAATLGISMRKVKENFESGKIALRAELKDTADLLS